MQSNLASRWSQLMPRQVQLLLAVVAWLAIFGPASWADPCGMVPPIYTGDGSPIVRIGQQMTYVFFRDGVETFVIRPGFSGKVDEFGMLIPFPTPPAIRKMPDHIFSHVAAAIDPPEVVIDLRPAPNAALFFNSAAPLQGLSEVKKAVRVIRREAVGMYEVAVLEAGSAAALKRWMDDHGFRYPDGMDDVCEDYVQDGWCFVAVKTKVGPKSGADPKPGQRRVATDLSAGARFDGHVQAMGFRFQTKELVVPMRLSAFNEGELHNILYLLTDDPQRINGIPEELVVRQIPGRKLIDNVTNLLPLRVMGGTPEEIDETRMRSLRDQRDPQPKNGAARQLFASDLRSVRTGKLSLGHEEEEKELLRIGEQLGLRGAAIDRLNGEVLAAAREKTVQLDLGQLAKMTLTVVDGDFPRDVLAKQNLTFSVYHMPDVKNKPAVYDAQQRGPAVKRSGVRVSVWETRPVQRPWFAVAAVLGVCAVGVLVIRRCSESL